MRHPALLVPASSVLVLLAACAGTSRHAGEGTLVLEGIPPVPAETAARLAPYQNTRGAAFADWTAAGDGLLVLTRFAETAQLHEVRSPGAYRKQLTFLREPVHAAASDPARRGGIYIRTDVGGGEFYQYHWLDPATGRTRCVTDGKSRHESLLPARRNGMIAYVSTRRNGKDFDIYVQDGPDPASARLVKEAAGHWSILDWSDDDARLLVMHTISINEARLFVLDIASGDATEINPAPGKKIAYEAARFAPGRGAVFYASDEDREFVTLARCDLATGAKTILDPVEWNVEALAVSPDGARLAYAINKEGASEIYLADTAAPEKARAVRLPAAGVASGLSFDPAGTRLAFSLSTSVSASDVYTADVATGEVARWTASELGGLDPAGFVAPELVRYRTFDGREIPAWYYRPRTSAGPCPVIISIHGGPEGQARPSFNPLVQYWVAELGAAVLLPNVRGSTGYGKTYLRLDNGMLREDSVKDIGALLDWLAARSELDASRVAVFGGSYGGYMVLASMIRYGDRLACGIDIVGISNFVTFLERTEAYRRDLRRVEYGDERDPAMRRFLISISPTTRAARITRPLFVAQGANDPRVPRSEAEQIVATVRRNGGTVWYLLARDEGHGFAKKTNRDFFTSAASVFLARYLLE